MTLDGAAKDERRRARGAGRSRNRRGARSGSGRSRGGATGGGWGDRRTRDRGERAQLQDLLKRVQFTQRPGGLLPCGEVRPLRVSLAERLERQHSPPVGVGDDDFSPVPFQHAGNLRDRLTRLREVGRCARSRRGSRRRGSRDPRFACRTPAPRVFALHTATSRLSTPLSGLCVSTSRYRPSGERNRSESRRAVRPRRRQMASASTSANSSSPSGTVAWNAE